MKLARASTPTNVIEAIVIVRLSGSILELLIGYVRPHTVCTLIRWTEREAQSKAVGPHIRFGVDHRADHLDHFNGPLTWTTWSRGWTALV
ncbi:hypothetical protein QE394_001044 [Arthrobacter sp. SORGH_AS 212]|nr:hypothetical protein [Arthrobacter sp. SORGH_AS_0212]